MAKKCSDDSMEYNEKQLKAASQRTSKAEEKQSDYSIEHKNAKKSY